MWLITSLLFFVSLLPATALELAPILETAAPETAPGEWRALGPLFGRETTDAGSLLACPRPLCTRFNLPNQTIGYDFLWPLGTGRFSEQSRRWRAALAFHTWRAGESSESDATSWGLIPLVWGGQTAQSEAYFALFPAGGTVRDLVGYERISFALFPLYLSTAKGESRNQAILWPIFSRTTGPVEKWRVFPLVGAARSEHSKRHFYLWPLVHTAETSSPRRQTTSSAIFVFPFYGRAKTQNAAGEQVFHSWSLLWPFFSGAEGEDFRRLTLAWPFYRSSSREGKRPSRTRYFWPFYGHASNQVRDYRFVMWPFWQHTSHGNDTNGSDFRYLLPFYWSFEHNAPGKPTRKFRQLWPFWKSDVQGDERHCSVLALWPQRNAAPIERNYAPFWTLYQSRRTSAGIRRDFLWGLFQYSQQFDTGQKRIRIFPLLEYRSEPGSWHLSFGSRKNPAPPAQDGAEF
jgi:hypothetical protein